MTRRIYMVRTLSAIYRIISRVPEGCIPLYPASRKRRSALRTTITADWRTGLGLQPRVFLLSRNSKCLPSWPRSITLHYFPYSGIYGNDAGDIKLFRTRIWYFNADGISVKANLIFPSTHTFIYIFISARMEISFLFFWRDSTGITLICLLVHVLHALKGLTHYSSLKCLRYIRDFPELTGINVKIFGVWERKGLGCLKVTSRALYKV